MRIKDPIMQFSGIPKVSLNCSPNWFKDSTACPGQSRLLLDCKNWNQQGRDLVSSCSSTVDCYYTLQSLKNATY